MSNRESVIIPRLQLGESGTQEGYVTQGWGGDCAALGVLIPRRHPALRGDACPPASRLSVENYLFISLFSQVMGELLKVDGAEGDGFWMRWKEILPLPSPCQYFPPGKEQNRDEIRQAGL